MDIPVDDNGQPITARLQRVARKTRDVDELIGICRGIAFDGQVNQTEAVQLLEWLSDNAELTATYPGDVLYERLTDVLSDDVLDEGEAKDVLDMILAITGGQVQAVAKKVDIETGEELRKLAPTELPITDGVDIAFLDQSFVLTGEFCSGKRRDIEKDIVARGGVCQKNPNRSTQYVAIGTFGSRDWVHGNLGRKIEGAIERKKAGQDIRLISEERLLKAFRETMPLNLENATYDGT
ncbi:BRCT domain-containing protein [Marinobacterium lutimaris]|uniref:BRCA1 C Terminus (BRCT) domain-containing protein n=1 Tax=Marinobacterium lutimaris TaxID=568106 RepID=A0A1H5XNK2_9GAMM|nr:BRCT domain-containing protein [Marinobacterium lutimaris]SEG13318.1 BRCA1 C Terminus (BRCT) domain-containing protein [Marinobacterium lutimaris]